MNITDIIHLPATARIKLAQEIGSTPMQSITVHIGEREQKIHLKMEGANPTGSMKDRTGSALIQDLEARDILTGESILVESTSGNLGVALAFLCLVKGYRFMAVVGTPAAPRKLTGIGSSQPSAFLHATLYDIFLLVKDEEAFACCRALHVATGLKVGGSSGAALFACMHYLLDHPDLRQVVLYALIKVRIMPRPFFMMNGYRNKDCVYPGNVLKRYKRTVTI